jgi:hypothetical protein
VVRDFVEHDVNDIAAQQLGIVSVEALERATVDRDLVRQRAGVIDPAPRERDALVEAEQRLPRRRLVLDDDLDVRDLFAQVVRQRVERVLDQALEVRAIDDGRTT